jgi:hypothetical protein
LLNLQKSESELYKCLAGDTEDKEQSFHASAPEFFGVRRDGLCLCLFAVFLCPSDGAPLSRLLIDMSQFFSHDDDTADERQ